MTKSLLIKSHSTSVLQQRTTQIQSNTSIKKTSVVLKESQSASSENAVSRKSSRQPRDSLKIIRLKKFQNMVSTIQYMLNLSN